MHEWALAEAVVKTVIKIADKENLRKVTCIKVRFGALQQIDEDVFQFALREMFPSGNDRFSAAELEFKREDAGLYCRVCGNHWEFTKEEFSPDILEAIHFVPEVARSYLRCPKCGSPDFNVERGRGVWLDSIEGEK